MFFWTAVVFLIYVYIYYAWREYCTKWETFFKIPGPKKLSWRYISTFFMSKEQNLKDFRKEALEFYPIYKHSTLTSKTVYLFSPEDLKIFFSNTQNLKVCALADTVGKSVLNADGAAYYYRKKLISTFFELENLLENLNSCKTASEYLFSSFVKKNPTFDIFKYTCLHFKSAILGQTEIISDEDFIVHLQEFRDNKPRCSAPFFRRKTGNLVKLINALDNIITARSAELMEKQSTTVCAADILIKEKLNGAYISNKGIRSELLTLLATGPATISLALQFLLLCLATHKKIQESVYKEITDVLGKNPKTQPKLKDLARLKYTEQCIKESLRMFPPVLEIRRKLMNNLKMSTGYTIPDSATVVVRVLDIHRHPELYPEADKYDPDRFAGDEEELCEKFRFIFIPFGTGKRECIGKEYTILMLKRFLCEILQQCSLKGIDSIDSVEINSGSLLTTKRDIRIQFEPRNSS